MQFSIGFHEDNEHHTFGIMRKGNYRPLSDFSFHFTMKVISDRSVSTGYLVSVMQEKTDTNDPERSARYAFFILAIYNIHTYQLYVAIDATMNLYGIIPTFIYYKIKTNN